MDEMIEQIVERFAQWLPTVVPRPTFKAELRADLELLVRRAAEAASPGNQIEKLQAFKDYVHKRLDDAGIPTHPNGAHSEEGCRVGDRLDIILAAEALSMLPRAIPSGPEAASPAAGWRTVPVEPTEAQWGGLARDVIMWMTFASPHYGSKLHQHLRLVGREVPAWLLKEIPDIDHTPPKGTIAAVIYKLMVEALDAPSEEARAG